MKINIIRAILILLLAGTFFSIFSFSNQDGEKSGNLSKAITKTITKDIKSVRNLEQNHKEKVLNRIESVIRKVAHFSIYAVVGFLLMGLATTYALKENDRIGLSLILGVIYAIADEIHQVFIPERTAQVADVIIDTMGVLFGILIILLLGKLIQKNNKQID